MANVNGVNGSAAAGDQLLAQLNSLAAQIQSHISSHPEDDATRLALKSAAGNLFDTLETPPESYFKVVMEPARAAAIRTAIEGGWLDLLADGKPVTADHIAKQCKADRQLVVRIMRVLTANGLVAEPDLATYQANKRTMPFTHPGFKNGVRQWFDNASTVFVKLPDYLKATSFTEPNTTSLTPYTFTHGQTFWSRLAAEPARQAIFDNYMTAHKSTLPSLAATYPIRDRLFPLLSSPTRPAAATGTLLVDVGGGQGHRLTDWLADALKKDGKVPGPCVLQDLPDVLPSATNEPAVFEQLNALDIKTMPHDFFTPQPVAGAAAYLFSSVLHNWPDDSCVQMLTHTARAMLPGYSKILVNDIVIPDTAALPWHANMDITMMSVLAGKERTRADWAAIFARAGCRIVEVFERPGGREHVIEVELA